MGEDQLDSLLEGLFSDASPRPDEVPTPESLGDLSGAETVRAAPEPGEKGAAELPPREVAPAGGQSSATEPVASLKAETLPQRILVMHSEPKSAQMLSDFYSKRGRKVWRADSLTQARIIVEQIRPDLVIADWGPQDYGWQDMLSSIRQQLPDTRVVLTRRHPTP